MNMQNSYLTSKPHYEILDGLRGVAAAMVVAFHLLEAHSGGNHLNQIINHGYLAVDFFFMLSGFVIGYAYDDRWNRMSTGTFFLLSGNGGRVRRCGAAGHAAGLYVAASAAEVGRPGMDGNAPAERAGMVALLRIHRQHIVRLVHPQVQQDGIDCPRGDSGVLHGTPLPYRTCRRHRGRMGFELGTAVRGTGPADVPLLRRTAPVPAWLADTHPQECFWVVQPDDNRRAFRAPYRWGGRVLDERALRGFLHHLHFPGYRLDGSGRQDNGQTLRCRMQVSGRHILSRLYHPLSAGLYLYGMGVQPSGDTCRRPSLHAAHVRRGVRACLCLPEVL